MLRNLGLVLFRDRARRLIASPAAVRRMRRAAGLMLVGVGLAIHVA